MLPVIKSLWIGSSLTQMEKLCIRSFLSWGHPFHLYLYQPIDGIPDGAHVLDANEVITKDRIFSNAGGTYAMFSNLFRYKLLELKGGFWVDMDVICLKPFEFQNEHIFATEMEKAGNETAATCVIKTSTSSKIMKDCFDTASTLASDVPWGTAGPKLLKSQIEAHRLGTFLETHDLFCPIHWWQTDELINKESNNRSFTSSFALHLWREMWRRKEHDPNAPHAGSIYGNLLERYGVL